MKYLTLILKISLYTLLAIAVFMLFSSKTAIFGLRSFVVVSGSMEPAIRLGSIVLTKSATNYKTGDVVSFNNKAGQTVTHRIMETKISPDGQSFILKGDANNTADGEEVKKREVIGKVYLAIPYLGRMVAFLRTLPGFLFLIIIPSVIFIGWEIINIKREMEKEIEKKIRRKMADL